jgi:hypothetical protein
MKKITSRLKTLIRRQFIPQSKVHTFGPSSALHTLVISVPNTFNINIPNAEQCIKMGFGKGFEKCGCNWQLVPRNLIETQLNKLENPIVFLSAPDYATMSKSLCLKLKKIPHFVWGSPDPDTFYSIYKKFNYEANLYLDDNIAEEVAKSDPDFIMMPCPESAKSFYSNFSKLGLNIESIPLACDTDRYFCSDLKKNYSTDNFFFCGGYWPKKAIQFDLYLKPYENYLDVYGYSKWPYSGYKGLLGENQEKEKYQQSILSPAISEPHAQYTGDIVERVFKILGSGGCAITDVNPYYKELFNSSELPVPASVDEYHEMIHELCNNKKLREDYRKKGYDAVMSRHTYKHRAERILDLLGVNYV